MSAVIDDCGHQKNGLTTHNKPHIFAQQPMIATASGVEAKDILTDEESVGVLVAAMPATGHQF
jgi:hypothetical protein